jgi:hypothetical protein
MQAVEDGAAGLEAAADPLRSALVRVGAPTPLTARPGTVKLQLAAETLGLYAGDWMHFQTYCAERGRAALPASPELVAGFLAAPGSGRAALARRLAAIDH